MVKIRKEGRHFLMDFPAMELQKASVEKLLQEADDMEEEVQELLNGAQKVAFPRVLYTVLPVEEKGDDYVVIRGISFSSALLRKNLDAVETVFAYVGTCGQELEQWSKECDQDFLIQYWADRIKRAYLQQGTQAFFRYLKEDVGLGSSFTRMNPGSLEAWPITEQKKLFACIGTEEIREKIGVSLTATMLMLPSKSVSGIAFSGEGKFENCQFCPRTDCLERRAPSLVI